jgi:hypothetical protein
MSLPDIRRYAELARKGSGTVDERFEILRRHEAKVRQQVADLQEALDVIQAKVALYADHLAAGSAAAPVFAGRPRATRPRTRFAIAISQGDQLLAAIGPHADYHQQAEFVFLQANIGDLRCLARPRGQDRRGEPLAFTRRPA